MKNCKCPKCGSTNVEEFTVSNSSKGGDFLSMIFDLFVGSIKGNRPENTIQQSYLDNKSSTSYTRKYKCKHCGNVWK